MPRLEVLGQKGQTATFVVLTKTSNEAKGRPPIVPQPWIATPYLEAWQPSD